MTPKRHGFGRVANTLYICFTLTLTLTDDDHRITGPLLKSLHWFRKVQLLAVPPTSTFINSTFHSQSIIACACVRACVRACMCLLPNPTFLISFIDHSISENGLDMT